MQIPTCSVNGNGGLRKSFGFLALTLAIGIAQRAAGASGPDLSQTNTANSAEAWGPGDGDLSGEISLADALAAALEHSPQLAAFDWDIRAAEAREIQARLRPNPDLSLEIEDVRWREGPKTESKSLNLSRAPGSVSSNQAAPGSAGASGNTASVPPTFTAPTYLFSLSKQDEEGARGGFGESTFTLRLTQLIELGGKRAARMHLAARNRELAAWDYETARADVCLEVAQAYVATLAAQERVKLAQEMVGLAEDTLRTVSARVQAGKVSPMEEGKAKIPLASARVDLDQAQRALETARARLAATWGVTAPSFRTVAGRLDDISEVPPFQELAGQVEKNPELARWVTELGQREAQLALQRANAVPDVSATLGFRTTPLPSHGAEDRSLNSDGSISAARSRNGYDRDYDNRLVLEFGVPLPIFDRGQGNIKEAEAMAFKAVEVKKGAEARVHSALAESYQALAGAYHAVSAARDEILPTARQNYDLTQLGYREGKFGYLDVLDAQRTLFQARAQYVDALAQYHEARASLDRLTGDTTPTAGDAPAHSPASKGQGS